MDQPIASYGISETNTVETPIDIAVEELTHNGFTIMESVLSDEQVQSLRVSLDELYAMQVADFGGEENLFKINDAFITRCPLAFDNRFLDLATHPILMEIARHLLGPSYVLMMQNGISNQPTDQNYQARWHRDLNYQHWTSSRPLAINALYPLDPFTEETGATFVLPGTHMFERFPSDPYIRKHQVVAKAKPGSIIICNAMTYHRAGQNSSNNVRRAVNNVIGLPFLSQQMDLPRILNGRWSEDPFLSAYLGYRWNPKEDILTWRRDKLAAFSQDV